MEPLIPWWKSGVIYHIYVRSFCDSNNDGIGDLKGVLSKLDYLADSASGLGVNALWLSPLFPSPDADFGYDVSDYTNIDPRYGTMGDLRELLAVCHARGLRVILDIPFNHTSHLHPWFVESRSSPQNPKRDWYIWHSGNGHRPPNNWASRFGGAAWSFDKTTNAYYLHSFLREQPDLNWRNPEVKKAVFDVMRFWFEFGVDGFRLDVFNYYFKDKALRNNPRRTSLRGLFYRYDAQRHVHDKDQSELFSLATEMRAFADSFGDKLLLAEVDSDNGRHVATQCLGPHGNGLHLAFNFEFLRGSFRATHFRQKVIRWERELPRKAWPTYVLGNHDVTRLVTRFGKKTEHARVLAALLLYLRGTPVLYYGDELGLAEAILPQKEIQDPAGKFAWPLYKGRDGCRTPMPWNANQHAGFTTAAKPWLPISNTHHALNVETSRQNEASLFQFYRKLLRVRRENITLQLGDLRFFKQKNPTVLVFSRTYGADCIVVILNFSKKPAHATLWQSVTVNDLMTGNRFLTSTLKLAPFEVMALRVEG